MSHAWMPFYVADYLGDTLRLSTVEHGAYLLLIMEYWQQRSLPDDDCELALIARMPEKEWKRIRPKIERFFQPGWKHKRCDQELIKADAKSAARSEAGSRGGKARRQQNESKPQAIASSLLDQNSTDDQASSPQPQFSHPSDVRTAETEKPKPSRKKTKAVIPEDAEPDDAEIDLGRQRNLSDSEIKNQWDRFKNNQRARGVLVADRLAAWRNWLTSPYFTTSENARAGPRQKPLTTADVFGQMVAELDSRNGKTNCASDAEDWQLDGFDGPEITVPAGANGPRSRD